MQIKVNNWAASVALFYVLFIYATSGVMRGIQQTARGFLGENFCWVMSASIGLFCLVGLLVLLPRIRLTPWLYLAFLHCCWFTLSRVGLVEHS